MVYLICIGIAGDTTIIKQATGFLTSLPRVFSVLLTEIALKVAILQPHSSINEKCFIMVSLLCLLQNNANILKASDYATLDNNPQVHC